MNKPSIALIPSGYKVGKLFTVLPELNADSFDFSRNVSAIRFDKNGLFSSVEQNTPRLNWLNNDSPSLMIENASTNILPYSSLFFNGGSSPQGYSIGFQTGDFSYEQLNYKGQNSSKQTQITTGRSYLDTGSVTLPSAGNYTFKMHVDLPNSSVPLSDVILLSTGFDSTISKTFSDVNEDGILEFSFSTSSSLSGSFRIGLGSNGNSNSGNFITISMPQLQQGLYSYSYIPTLGSSASRLGESLFKTGLGGYIDNSEGVIYADISFNNIKSFNTFNSISLEEDAGNSQDLISFFQSNLDNEIKVYFRQSNSTIINVTYTLQSTSFNKIALWYKSGATKLFINGAIAATTDAGNATIITTPFNNFELSRVKTIFNNQADYNLKDFRVYKRGNITNEELIKLTTI